MENVIKDNNGTRKILNNNMFILIVMFLTLIVFSIQFSNSWTYIDEVSQNITKNNIQESKEINRIFEILKSAEFQVVSRLITLVFSIYVISFFLWVIMLTLTLFNGEFLTDNGVSVLMSTRKGCKNLTDSHFIGENATHC